MQITRYVVGEMSNNAYLLRCEETGELLLIDAAAEPETLLAAIGDRPLSTIVTTHRHHDHVGALSELALATGAQLVAGTPDADALGVPVDRKVWTGDTVSVGTTTLEVIGLVGHTPGSIALAWTPTTGPAQIFTGDSLFPGGVGRTWAAKDFVSLIDDVEAKLFDVYADDTVIHPGHGLGTTLGAERPELASWRARGW